MNRNVGELETAPDGTARRAHIRPTSRQTPEAGKEPSPGGKAARPALVAGTGGAAGAAETGEIEGTE